MKDSAEKVREKRKDSRKSERKGGTLESPREKTYKKSRTLESPTEKARLYKVRLREKAGL